MMDRIHPPEPGGVAESGLMRPAANRVDGKAVPQVRILPPPP